MHAYVKAVVPRRLYRHHGVCKVQIELVEVTWCNLVKLPDHKRREGAQALISIGSNICVDISLRRWLELLSVSVYFVLTAPVVDRIVIAGSH